MSGRDVEDLLRDVKFEGLEPTESGAVLRLSSREAKGVIATIAAAMIKTLGAAENYVEIDVRPRLSNKKYTLTIRRAEKPTPHELRRQAEAERDALAATLEHVRTELLRGGQTPGLNLRAAVAALDAPPPT